MLANFLLENYAVDVGSYIAFMRLFFNCLIHIWLQWKGIWQRFYQRILYVIVYDCMWSNCWAIHAFFDIKLYELSLDSLAFNLNSKLAFRSFSMFFFNCYCFVQSLLCISSKEVCRIRWQRHKCGLPLCYFFWDNNRTKNIFHAVMKTWKNWGDRPSMVTVTN